MTTAQEIVTFWTEAGYERWFGKDEAFDRQFAERFGQAHDAAAAGELDHWNETPEGALALQILLDQYPRNAFRGTARMFATDAKAKTLADAALAAGHDAALAPDLRTFLYLAFEHSEDMADQERAVALFEPLGGDVLDYARLHRDVIARFGRFPHRNALLGRETSDEEVDHLRSGGFAG
jgi:uncharacterized protein (DUF924 family)